MRRRARRMWALGIGAVALAGAGVLTITALRKHAVYFFAPSELAGHAPAPGTLIRIGGRVRTGSLQEAPDGAVTFVVTDCLAETPVHYRGALPDLFREGQEVVTQGAFDGHGVFEARQVLAKHDENYAPPEAAAALKKTGCWDDPAAGA